MIDANLSIQLPPFVSVRHWFSESVIQPCAEVNSNTPSTLPMTVGVGVEEIVKLRVNNVGARTIGSKSSIVDLGTVDRSDMRLLDGGGRARTRLLLCGARQSL